MGYFCNRSRSGPNGSCEPPGVVITPGSSFPPYRVSDPPLHSAAENTHHHEPTVSHSVLSSMLVSERDSGFSPLQDDCKFRNPVRRDGRWSASVGRRSIWLVGAWTLGWEPSLQAQGVQSGVDQGGEYLAQARPAQRVDILIPAGVLHVVLAVLDAPVVAEQPEQLSRPTFTRTQAGQQIPAFSGYLPGGYSHSHPLHYCPLPRAGKSQLLPDIISQFGISPNPPSLNHSGFFSRVSALPLPQFLPGKTVC